MSSVSVGVGGVRLFIDVVLNTIGDWVERSTRTGEVGGLRSSWYVLRGGTSRTFPLQDVSNWGQVFVRSTSEVGWDFHTVVSGDRNSGGVWLSLDQVVES